MKRNSVLIVGCGDLGVRVGMELEARGWAVHAARRNCAGLPLQFECHEADYTQAGSLRFAESLEPDYVLATFVPADSSESGYRSGFAGAAANLVGGLGDHRPAAMFMASSTRVFAENQGGWVDESSPTSESDPRAATIIEAERILLGAGAHASVVRFGGIYGAPGGRLLQRIRRGQVCDPSPVFYSNRLHRDDCAGFLVYLMIKAAAGDKLEPVYIGVDDAPAPRFEVESWLADTLGVSASLRSPARGSDVAAGKRCRNTLLHRSGYRLRYPDYRSGYLAVLENG